MGDVPEWKVCLITSLLDRSYVSWIDCYLLELKGGGLLSAAYMEGVLLVCLPCEGGGVP